MKTQQLPKIKSDSWSVFS